MGSVVLSRPVHAASTIDVGLFQIDDIVNLPDQDPRTIAVRLINVSLEFIGIIMLVMVLWGGFQFLLSGGDATKMSAAGRTIWNAIIGLIIILSAWAIVRFVLVQFINAAANSADSTPSLQVPNILPK